MEKKYIIISKDEISYTNMNDKNNIINKFHISLIKNNYIKIIYYFFFFEYIRKNVRKWFKISKWKRRIRKWRRNWKNEEEEKSIEKENEEEEEEKKSENDGLEAFESDKDNEKISNDDDIIIQKNNENFIKTFPYLKQDSNGKSIFSQISENLYKQYLSKDQKFDIFEELTWLFKLS